MKFVVILALCLSLTVASTHPDDRAALVALYNSAGGAEWDPNNWADVIDAGDPCEDSWPATASFACTGEAGDDDRRITVLNLAFNNMVGGLPSELADMTSLETLALEGSRLDGTIPDLSALTSLKYLGLHTNKLVGSVPHLPETLESLFLNYNDLNGPFPETIQDMSNLHSLSLGWNSFSGDIPSWFSSLNSLTKVLLLNNDFTGPLPDLSAMAQLVEFRAANNEFSGSLWETPLPANLTKLALESNLLTGTIPSWMEERAWAVIDLWENPFDCPVNVGSDFVDTAHVNCGCPVGEYSLGPEHGCDPCSDTQYQDVTGDYAFAGVSDDQCQDCPSGRKQDPTDPRFCVGSNPLGPIIAAGGALVVILFLVAAFIRGWLSLASLTACLCCRKRGLGDEVDESYKPLGDE